MSLKATVRATSGKELEARMREHRIVTDRSADEGGNDRGPTSGELLLAAIGSCATGGVRNLLQSRGAPVDGLRTDVSFAASDVPGERDRIQIEITLPPGSENHSDSDIRAAALQGRVVSRVHAGSTTEVLIHRTATQNA